MRWAILAPIVIVAGAAAIIALEVLAPVRRRPAVPARRFWVDLVTYALLQSYVLALVINLLIDWIDGWTGALRRGLVSGWPIAAQVAFFVIRHDFYIYWFHRLQHGTGGCGGCTRRTTRRATSTGSRARARTRSRS